MSLGRLAMLLCCAQLALYTHTPTEGLPPGAWAVGFNLFTLPDPSRSTPSGQPRAIEVGLWYPAREPSEMRLTYRDYFLAAADAHRDELDQFVAFLRSRGAADSVVERWLSAPMHATRDAPRAAGRYPLVLLAQGNAQTVQDQAYLAEYLASYGYVVATTPSPMLITGPLTDESQVGARSVEQARDLAFARDALADRPNIEERRTGIVAHSFGARAALLLAMSDTGVAAVVSLDGGIGTATGRSSFEALPDYRAAGVRAPILHFYERLDAFMTPDFDLLGSLTASDRWLVAVPDLHHHHFTSLGAASIEFPSLQDAIGATNATGDAYVSVARGTLEFLDAFVKQDSTARRHFHFGATWPHLGPMQEIVADATTSRDRTSTDDSTRIPNPARPRR